MCIGTGLAALSGLLTGAGATAAGATALATTVSIGGAVLQGIQGFRAAKANVAAIEDQKRTEAALTATEDARTRQKFRSGIAQQRAELAARGVTLDSVTSVALGQTAAQELSFESQRIRSEGSARQTQLTNEQRQMRADGLSSILRGTAKVADTLLTAAPDLWPGFGRGGQTA